jgi:2-isopropylmalate synthase
MKAEHGLELPRRLQIELSKTVQHITEDTGTEIHPSELWATFQREYLPEEPPISLLAHELTTKGDGAAITAQLMVDGEHTTITGKGNGPIAAFVHGLQTDLGVDVEVVDYSEHAVTAGTDAQAVAYVEARSEDGIRWGVGMDESITTASLKAVLSAVNRLRVDES